MKEIEVKILEIEPEKMEAGFERVGAVKEFDYLFRAAFFDDAHGTIQHAGGLLRLRQEGPHAALTHKTLISTDDVKIMEEVETQVADPGSMIMILKQLGYRVVRETTKQRIQYSWKRSHFVIDIYKGDLEGIPPLLEIESPDEEELQNAVEALGYKMSDTRPWNTYDLIQHYGIGTSN